MIFLILLFAFNTRADEQLVHKCEIAGQKAQTACEASNFLCKESLRSCSETCDSAIDAASEDLETSIEIAKAKFCTEPVDQIIAEHEEDNPTPTTQTIDGDLTNVETVLVSIDHDDRDTH